MRTFLQKNGMYLFIGIAVIVVLVLGVLALMRTTLFQQPAKNSSEVSFQIGQPAPTQPAEISGRPVCVSLTASPSSGPAPLTVSFSGTARGTQGDNLLLSFSFGDGEEQVIERVATSPEGTETQVLSHTYVSGGNYQGVLIVENEIGEYVNTCEQTIVVGENLTANDQPVPTTTSNLNTNFPTDSPDENLVSSSPAPTTLAQNRTPSPTMKASPTKKPTPTTKPSITTKPSSTPFPVIADDGSVPVPNVPKAGGFPLTVVTAAGGIAIVLLAFLL